MRAVILAGCVAGCEFSPQVINNDASAREDAALPDVTLVDVSMVLDDAPPLCVGGTFLRICVDEPMNSLTLNGNLDTGNAETCAPFTATPNLDVCVIAATSLVVQNVRATGPRPLVLVSASTISVTGTLDVSSRRPDQLGAGAEPPQCVPPSPASINILNGHSGGGGGGSFGGAGGIGGSGATGGIGGQASSAQIVDRLRGGCSGGTGAGVEGVRGQRGRGGGAVGLLAIGEITIQGGGVIDASGSGGGGGGAPFLSNIGGGAGGGGASGGMILLDGSVVGVLGDGKLIAAGGGGGEGGQNEQFGMRGTDPNAPNSRAAGGTGGSSLGGAGGDGADRSNQNGLNGANGAPSSGSGGGGGGGAGAIRVRGEQSNVDQSNVSPMPLAVN